MRPTKKQKRAFIDWLTSPAGTRPEPFLRPFTPGMCTRASLRIQHLLGRKRMLPGSKRLYLPSPPFVKVIALRRYARHFGLQVFIETGTAAGETTAGVADLFQRCTTIELSEHLHARAASRFARLPHVLCLRGDSGIVLEQVLAQLGEPALFWLDAHASGGDTADAGYDPIFKELAAIYAHPVEGHVILIDDARGHHVEKIAGEAPASHEVAIRNDIIRIVPRRAPRAN